jgi:anti-sigma factor (TIGR02949 family)
MDCKTALALIDLYLDDELDRGEARALEAHLDACPDCAAALSRADALRRALREPALRHAAPQALRERIRETANAFAQDPSPGADVIAFAPRARSGRRWAPGLGIAAAFVLAFAAGGLAMRLWPDGNSAANDEALLTHDLFASHWRALAATSPVDVVSSDHHTVKPWFEGRLAESPPVHDFAAQGFVLIGGRVDYAGTQRVAALVYRHGQHLVDVYVLPQAAGTLAPHAESRGYSADVVMIGSQSVVIVSDIDATERARFATLLREKR